MACKEAKSYEKRIAWILAKKYECPYSTMVGYVRGRMSMAIIRSNTMMLFGVRLSKRFIPELEGTAAHEALQERNLDW